jgi:hypothetical protein
MSAAWDSSPALSPVPWGDVDATNFGDRLILGVVVPRLMR